jgi:hypothetical protein
MGNSPTLAEQTKMAYHWAAQDVRQNDPAAKAAANLLLNNSTLLKSLDEKLRVVLVDRLFVALDLKPGWRKVAEEGGLTPGFIATLITRRVRAIKSRADAAAEATFVDELLQVPSDDRLRYQPIMTKAQLRTVANTLWQHAQEKMKAVRDPRSFWRYITLGGPR